MADRGTWLVDVFHDGAFSGNPLAVIASDTELDAATMQRMTRWFNLSETAFLLPPTDPAADYRVRIFTLERELPFAGHPTLGSCHAWLEAGGTPRDPDRIVQQCGAGLVSIRRDGDRLAFAAPPLIRSGPVERAHRAAVARVLHLDPAAILACEWVDNGPGWIGVLLASAYDVLHVQPMRHHPGRVEIGLIGPQPAGSDTAWEVRTFFTDAQHALTEDPVTGSFNASIAQWLRASGRADTGYVAAQGTALGRRGRVYVDYDADGQAWVGGRSQLIVGGALLV
ncbi:PhzF family phenazine biosynthesis protein [Sphingomonas sp. KR1UV-12]|uniref:PhzF family phenazine biosynthesis protein n=1 Tax=Sphingomonas aurea TaxID=3063994 RepID=A0ABT9EMB6_9SPHN|nr:PhzF family phenazine biosynthesis protein [Sphingomonas sp. KR1UV-12]MDP1028091.1 PhzF family phenazine biosynthesis protein [Sphingomonas sp. KR1UV-12]